MRLTQLGEQVDRRRRFRMPGEAEAEHRDIAEPECQAGDEADLGDLDGIEPPAGIDAIAHRASGEDAGPDVVADRIGGEAGERGDTVRHVAAPDRAQREQIVERQGEVCAGDEQRGLGDVPVLDRRHRGQHLGEVDVVELAVQHHRRNRDDGDAQDKADPVPTDLLIEEPRHRAQPMHSPPQIGAPAASRRPVA